jgi:predicted PurR-regulated permease PerM
VSRLPYIGNQLIAIFEPFEDLRALLKQHALPWVKQLATPALGVMSNIGQNAVVLLFTLFTMFFLFRDGPQVVDQFRQVFDQVLGERTKGYLHTIETTVKAVVYGIVLTAIAQGAIAGMGYWLVGVKAPILLAIVTTMFAMIPFGTPVVWVSVSLLLLLEGDTWAGVSLLLWGSLVVSWVDNISRPLVISSSTRIPFVLVMFGVLGGLASFGFIGLFLGPVILAMALAIWREWQQVHEAPQAGS